MTFAPNLLVAIVIVWAIVLFIMYGGIKKGIELSNKIFIPYLRIYHSCP